MSDIFEEAKEYRREACIITHDRLDGRIIDFKDADKFIDYFDKLIAEVERLNDCLLHETTSLQTAANVHLKSQLEAVTKERDDLRDYKPWKEIQRLEAENAELKNSFDAVAYKELKTVIESLTNDNVGLISSVQALRKKLTASEKKVGMWKNVALDPDQSWFCAKCEEHIAPVDCETINADSDDEQETHKNCGGLVI